MNNWFLKIEQLVWQFFIKNRNTFIAFVPFVIWFCLTCYLLFKPSSGNIKSEFLVLLSKMQVDKLVHGMIFFGLIFLLNTPLFVRRKEKGWLLFTFILFFLWAFISEWIQLEFVANRDFDLLDSVADIVGLLLGVYYFYKVYKNKTNHLVEG